MRREIIFFDREVIVAEFKLLPERDEVGLHTLIARLEEAPVFVTKPILIEDYGEIKCLRDRDASYQGRCLFFVAEAKREFQKLVIVKVYKKEKQAVPKSVMATAIQRKNAWLEENKP